MNNWRTFLVMSDTLKRITYNNNVIPQKDSHVIINKLSYQVKAVVHNIDLEEVYVYILPS